MADILQTELFISFFCMKMVENGCIWIQISPNVSKGPINNKPTLVKWVTHMCTSKLTIIGSDDGLLPGQCRTIIWNNAETLLTEPSGTNFSEILTEIHTFLLKKMHLKMSSGKWWPFCLGLNVLTKLFEYHFIPKKNSNFINIFISKQIWCHFLAKGNNKRTKTTWLSVAYWPFELS